MSLLTHSQVVSALACPVEVREAGAVVSAQAVCKHARVFRQSKDGYRVAICECGHHWTEWPLKVRS